MAAFPSEIDDLADQGAWGDLHLDEFGDGNVADDSAVADMSHMGDLHLDEFGDGEVADDGAVADMSHMGDLHLDELGDDGLADLGSLGDDGLAGFCDMDAIPDQGSLGDDGLAEFCDPDQSSLGDDGVADAGSLGDDGLADDIDALSGLDSPEGDVLGTSADTGVRLLPCVKGLAADLAEAAPSTNNLKRTLARCTARLERHVAQRREERNSIAEVWNTDKLHSGSVLVDDDGVDQVNSSSVPSSQISSVEVAK
jgi:hypothetical protein